MSEDRTRSGLDRVFTPKFLPSHLFGGRARTSTVILVIAWLALYCLYVFLNPEEPEPSVVTGPPAATSEVPSQTVEPTATETTPETTTETTPEPTTTAAPEATTGPAEPGDTETPTTTTRQSIPGFPGLQLPGEQNEDTPTTETEPAPAVTGDRAP